MKTNFHHYPNTPITAHKNVNNPAALKGSKSKFAETFRETIEKTTSTSNLTLSKHAQVRLQQRNISIDEQTWTTIEQKLQTAKTMGVKDSLVLFDEAALIVSVKNNVVVTAMSREEAATQIFTNINGTIIM